MQKIQKMQINFVKNKIICSPSIQKNLVEILLYSLLKFFKVHYAVLSTKYIHTLYTT